jgi:hypothetical protein
VHDAVALITQSQFGPAVKRAVGHAMSERIESGYGHSPARTAAYIAEKHGLPQFLNFTETDRLLEFRAYYTDWKNTIKFWEDNFASMKDRHDKEYFREVEKYNCHGVGAKALFQTRLAEIFGGQAR